MHHCQILFCKLLLVFLASLKLVLILLWRILVFLVHERILILQLNVCCHITILLYRWHILFEIKWILIFCIWLHFSQREAFCLFFLFCRDLSLIKKYSNQNNKSTTRNLLVAGLIISMIGSGVILSLNKDTKTFH